jgi:Phosphopantetheinyl transferase
MVDPMDNDKTYRLLDQYLNTISQNSAFHYRVVDMRKMLRLLHQNKPEISRILSLLELKQLEKLTMAKKKIQWLSGRYAIKSALFKYKALQGRLMDLGCIDIMNGINSAPYIVQFPEIRISITHSYPYCIGVVSDYPIGVDLEKVITIRASLIDYYFHPSEIKHLTNETNTGENNKLAITYWTRKEAVSKLLRLGMKMDFRQIDTANDRLEIDQNNDLGIKLKSFLVSDYCFSIALEEPIVSR